MGIQYKILMLVALVGLAYGLAPANNACAQETPTTPPATGGGGSSGGGTIANQTCDTQVWRTMEARARLETEREIMQNQNLIFKADSVLTYTCFDSFASHAANTVGPLFTHTTYFNGTEIISSTGANSMGTALQSAVIGAMTPYISGNFGHALLGGRGSELNLPQVTPTAITGSGSTYTCGQMSQVWSVAKCMNFLHTTNFALYDGFYPFINLAAQNGGESVEGYQGKNDTRRFPTACSGTPITGSTWETMYRTSRNENNFGDPSRLYPYAVPNRTAFQQVRERVQPPEGDQCSQPIRTGVRVILSVGSSTPYEDGVCTNPGCSLAQNGSRCTNTFTTPTSGGSASP